MAISGGRDLRSAVSCALLHHAITLAEQLTDRELSIPRALQGSANQRGTGAALFPAINTVKAYDKSLYRKLGVASRHDAVVAARDLGLI